MATINPYLNFPGTTEEAFNFYKSVIGGEFGMVQRFKETPYASTLSAEDGEKIIHITFPIGPNRIMGTDTLESLGQKNIVGNNMYVSLQAASKEEADHLFNGLSAGGVIENAIADMPWGSYFGAFKDKYGISWMVNFDYPQTN